MKESVVVVWFGDEKRQRALKFVDFDSIFQSRTFPEVIIEERTCQLVYR